MPGRRRIGQRLASQVLAIPCRCGAHVRPPALAPPELVQPHVRATLGQPPARLTLPAMVQMSSMAPACSTPGGAHTHYASSSAREGEGAEGGKGCTAWGKPGDPPPPTRLQAERACY